MSLFERYFEKRNNLSEEIEALDKKHQLHFLMQLQKETDRSNFLSTISEFYFARFFDLIATKILHDNKILNKRPDFILTVNSQQIIAEVARLNPSETDQKQLQFENAFMTTMEEIKIGCMIDFDYDQKTIVSEEVNLNLCKSMLAEWLAAPRSAGDQQQLPFAIRIEFLYYSDKLDHVCLIGGGGSISFDFRRLEGPNSPLLRKSNKYNKLIDSFQMPYIICFDLDFHSWFSKRDLYPKLYGSSVANYDRNHILTKSHMLDGGLYYLPHRPFQKVAGILLCEGSEFTYFHNYAATVKLSNENEQLFSQWQHRYH